MNFKQCEILKSYINQGSDNFVDAFLKPLLKEAVKYRRSVGYFSSSVFSLIVNSLPSFIQNGGQIELIVSPELSKEDVQAIQVGYEKKEDIISRKFINDFSVEIELFDDSCLNILAELVARNILNIKVAAVKNNVGIYHDKLGILTDRTGNNVVFYGSANSSANAYVNNYEKVRVVKDWDTGSIESVLDEIQEFDKLWNNKNEFLDVYDFMDSVKKCILAVKERRAKLKLANMEMEMLAPIVAGDYQKNRFSILTSQGKEISPHLTMLKNNLKKANLLFYPISMILLKHINIMVKLSLLIVTTDTAFYIMILKNAICY